LAAAAAPALPASAGNVRQPNSVSTVAVGYRAVDSRKKWVHSQPCRVPTGRRYRRRDRRCRDRYGHLGDLSGLVGEKCRTSIIGRQASASRWNCLSHSLAANGERR